jgi:uncharacterized protein YeaO (DUF488 family)
MLRAATVEDIANKRISKNHGRVVVVTRYYPRFLKRQLIDDYFSVLAPPKILLHEFKNAEKALEDHDKAFSKIHYEKKFSLQREALEVLRELSALSFDKHVYLVCHCSLKQCCHRELLFMICEKHFGAKIPTLSHSYETFRKRLDEFAPAKHSAESDGLLS